MTTTLVTANSIKASLAATLVANNVHTQLILQCFDAVDRAIPCHLLHPVTTPNYESSGGSEDCQMDKSRNQCGSVVPRGVESRIPKKVCRRFLRSGHCKYGSACFYAASHTVREDTFVSDRRGSIEVFNIASDAPSDSASDVEHTPRASPDEEPGPVANGTTCVALADVENDKLALDYTADESFIAHVGDKSDVRLIQRSSNCTRSVVESYVDLSISTANHEHGIAERLEEARDKTARKWMLLSRRKLQEQRQQYARAHCGLHTDECSEY